ncbi:MAG: hypothetical protein ABI082_07185 [Dokdonella sp.]
MRRAAWGRAALFTGAVLASWIALLLFAAQVEWRSPLGATTERSFHGNEFHAVFGAAVERGTHLHVEASDKEFSALQSLAPEGLQAADFSILRYRFKNFPRTLELSLVFRTEQEPNDVQSVALPWPGAGVSSFEVSRIAGWRGTIIELGFAEFATAQNVPPALGFRPFDVVGIKLSSPSWRGDLATLATNWFGAWPWSQRSVHSLGREGEAPRAHSVVLAAAAAAVIAIAWAIVLLRVRGRRLLMVSLACAALAWFALDMRWQAGLVQRLLATRTLYAGTTWEQRARTVGDSDIQQAADDMKSRFLGDTGPARVLVESSSRYQSLRLIWHLLPMNAGELAQALPLGAPLPDDCLIVFLDSNAWRSDPAMRTLLAHSQRIEPAAASGANGFDPDRLVVFRYRHAH